MLKEVRERPGREGSRGKRARNETWREMQGFGHSTTRQAGKRQRKRREVDQPRPLSYG